MRVQTLAPLVRNLKLSVSSTGPAATGSRLSLLKRLDSLTDDS